jgi:hypothetical protein
MSHLGTGPYVPRLKATHLSRGGCLCVCVHVSGDLLRSLGAADCPVCTECIYSKSETRSTDLLSLLQVGSEGPLGPHR